MGSDHTHKRVRRFVPGQISKKKGENLATKEDIKDLAAVLTHTTEEIKAEITDKSWDRQKQWEMKRDVLFDCVRALGNLDDALLQLVLAFRSNIATQLDDSGRQAMGRTTAVENWNGASASFEKSKFLVFLMCEQDVKMSLNSVSRTLGTTSSAVMKGNPGIYSSAMSDIHVATEAVYYTVRKSLGLSESLLPREKE